MAATKNNGFESLMAASIWETLHGRLESMELAPETHEAGDIQSLQALHAQIK